MKITFISDTHGYHDQLNLDRGDMLIHSGDVSKTGSENEVKEFLNWFSNLNFEYKIFIAGNHDFYFEKEEDSLIQKLIPKDIHYLNDSGIQINGINIWGSPIQPWFFDWAFNRKRGEVIRRHWDMIPNGTDILITHGPPLGILDETIGGKNVGCKDLLEVVQKIKPKIHSFGHIHESYGILDLDGVKYINASVLNIKYQLVNRPVEIEYSNE